MENPCVFFLALAAAWLFGTLIGCAIVRWFR